LCIEILNLIKASSFSAIRFEQANRNRRKGKCKYFLIL